ncbi:MAG: YicC/YloC family endoribonuclease [Desulfosalsimonadaceae bacterium]
MIRSMTAYAGAENTAGAVRAAVEIRGYNSRYLDIFLKLPPGYQFLEENIRPAVAGRISRGRIEIRLSVQCGEEAAESFALNESVADGYYAALAGLKNRFGLKEDVPLSLLAAKTGIIEPVQPETDPQTIWQAVAEPLNQALEDFTEMKAAEGANTAEDLENRLNAVAGYLGEIQERAPELPAHYQQRLKERIHKLTSGMVSIDEARIAQESAFLADKCDISEEISRSRSHLNQFRHLMDAPEPAGRPLNFLLQEFNREFTTMGSKAANAEISHIIVSAKTELEKMREQVQNIE